MKFYSLIVVCVLFIGCGADEDAVFEVEPDKAPVISLKVVSETFHDTRYIVKIAFKVVSDTAIKTDMPIRFDTRSTGWRSDEGCFQRLPYDVPINDRHEFRESNTAWAMIPKGQKESKVITRICQVNSRFGGWVLPLPVITVVGEGEVIDQEYLGYWQHETVHDEVIRKGFVFPYYEIANDAPQILYAPKTAKVVAVDPPNGSRIIEKGDYSDLKIKVTFDTPPECPQFLLDGDDRFYVSTSSDDVPGTVFYITIPNLSRHLSKLIPEKKVFLVLEWGKDDLGVPQEHQHIIKYTRVLQR